MLARGFGKGARRRKLQARVAFACLQQARDDRHTLREAGCGVKRHVKLGIERAGSSDPTRGDHRFECVLRALDAPEIHVRQPWDGVPQQTRLKHDAEIEYVIDLLLRQPRYECALVRDHLNEALRLELEQSLPHGDAADAERLGQHVLTELRAGGMLAVEDRGAQTIGDRGREGAVGKRDTHVAKDSVPHANRPLTDRFYKIYILGMPGHGRPSA